MTGTRTAPPATAHRSRRRPVLEDLGPVTRGVDDTLFGVGQRVGQGTRAPFTRMAEAVASSGEFTRVDTPWPATDGTRAYPSRRRLRSRGIHHRSATWRQVSTRFALRLQRADAGPRTRDAALAAMGAAVVRAVPVCALSRCSVCRSAGATASFHDSDGFDGHARASAAARGFPPTPRLRSARPAARSLTPPPAPRSCPFRCEPSPPVPPPPTRPREVVCVSPRSQMARQPLRISTSCHPCTGGRARALCRRRVAAARFPDPFAAPRRSCPGTGSKEHVLNDARAYNGLSDDAGGGNPLGFASKVRAAPTQHEVDQLDAFIEWTLYGVKRTRRSRRSSRCSCGLRMAATLTASA